MTNAISAHKDELEKLIEDLSGDIAVSGITFVAVVDAYIARLDGNLDGWCDTSLEHFDSEIAYFSKAGQQAHSALIFKRAPVDEATL